MTITKKLSRFIPKAIECLFLKKKIAVESTATDQAPTVTSHVTVAIGHHDEH